MFTGCEAAFYLALEVRPLRDPSLDHLLAASHGHQQLASQPEHGHPRHSLGPESPGQALWGGFGVLGGLGLESHGEKTQKKRPSAEI